jgi:hypothetical protein
MTQGHGSRPGGQPPGGGYDRNGRGRRPPDHNDEIAQALIGTGKIDLWSGGNRPSLRPELLDADAQTRAMSLREVPSSQLRRFYGQAVAFKQRLQIDGRIADTEVRAQVAYLKASSACGFR